MKPLLLLLLGILILASGCVNLFQPTQGVGGGLSLNMRADPSTVFSSSDVRLDIDVDNENPRNISDVLIDVFDSGYTDVTGIIDRGTLTPVRRDPSVPLCGKSITAMRPNGFQSLTCVLTARNITQDSLVTTVSARVKYATDLSFVQIINIMNENEYVREQQQGQLVVKPAAYSYADRNVQIDVEFSEPLPVVVRSKEYFMYITVKNIGNGFINDIGYGQLNAIPVISIQPRVDGSLVQTLPQDIVNCPDLQRINWKIQPIGKTFPKIACSIKLPLGVNVIENYGLLINLRYNYEVRGSTDIKIIR